MNKNWRERVEGRVTGSSVTQKIWPKLGQHQYSVGRMANFALGSLYGSGIGAADLAKRATSTMHQNRGQNRDIAAASVAALRFLGDNFNKYLGGLEPKDYLERPSHTGSKPSSVLLEALTHEEAQYNGGIKFPETLDLLEQSGIISKEDFFKFANLQAICDEEIAKLATSLASTDDKDKRSAIRDKMVEINCDSVGTLLCAFAHMFKPNPAISDAEDLTLDTLHALYPMQMEIGQAWQYSYGSVACLNRITREQQGAMDEPDPVIAELERMGAYTDELVEEICKLAHEKPDAKTIQVGDLPAPLQDAIRTVGARAEEKIKQIPNAGRVRKAIYNGINTLNSGVAVCNQAAPQYFNSAPEHRGCTR